MFDSRGARANPRDDRFEVELRIENVSRNMRNALQAYVRYLEEISNCRVSAIGVGQDRNATISLHDLID